MDAVVNGVIAFKQSKLLHAGKNDYGKYGNGGNYKKLMKEFILKDESPGKRFKEANFLS